MSRTTLIVIILATIFGLFGCSSTNTPNNTDDSKNKPDVVNDPDDTIIVQLNYAGTPTICWIAHNVLGGDGYLLWHDKDVKIVITQPFRVAEKSGNQNIEEAAKKIGVDYKSCIGAKKPEQERQ